MTIEDFKLRYEVPENKDQMTKVFLSKKTDNQMSSISSISSAKKMEITFERQNDLLDLISNMPKSEGRKNIFTSDAEEFFTEDAHLIEYNNKDNNNLEKLLKLKRFARSYNIKNDSHLAYVYLVHENGELLVLPIKQYNGLFILKEDKSNASKISVLVDTGVADFEIEIMLSELKGILFLRGKTIGRNIRRGVVYLRELKAESLAKTNFTKQSLNEII